MESSSARNNHDKPCNWSTKRHSSGKQQQHGRVHLAERALRVVTHRLHSSRLGARNSKLRVSPACMQGNQGESVSRNQQWKHAGMESAAAAYPQ
jgi:hypothetical protein